MSTPPRGDLAHKLLGIGGPHGVKKRGRGLLRYLAANAYTGTTTVTGGSLQPGGNAETIKGGFGDRAGGDRQRYSLDGERPVGLG